MSKNKHVEPRTLKGFNDQLPEDVIARIEVVGAIEKVFRRFGFIPLETPALEHLDVLLGTGGDQTNKELFRLESPEGDEIALRFDHTVPFARLLAQYPDKLKTPFRRYAIGPVWRADKPGPGRFRQFTQFDIDIAGSNVIACDAEIVAVTCEAMQSIGLSRFTVLVNNRKLIDALLESTGIKEEAKHKHILRVIDKLQKVGVDNVRLELGPGRVDESGDPIPGVNLKDEAIDAVLTFIAVKGDSRSDVVDHVESALPDSQLAKTAVAEMRELDECLIALGVSEEHGKFDPSLARGLDYYTGPVFEVALSDAPEFGSVGGGGRYDGLVQRFMNRPIPCTGISVGLDRLLAALAHLEIQPRRGTLTDVLVVTMGKVPKSETLKIAQELRSTIIIDNTGRKRNINTEAFLASKKKMGMGNQLSHADHYAIPVAVIIGEDELANGQVSVKDLMAGKEQREGIEDRDEYRQAGKAGQVTVERAEMIKTVAALLDAKLADES